jgi:hypothetical protein
VPVLPPPPRVTSAGRLVKKVTVAVLIGLLGLGMLGGIGYYAFYEARGLIEDRDVFARGVAAAEGRVEGKARSRRIFFHEYELTLRYTDRSGAHHSTRQAFDTAFGEVDEAQRPEIRYDPDRPDRAASSWSIDVTASRALWAALAALMALVGGFVVYAGARGVRDAVLERRAARDGREVRARLAEKSRVQYGNVTYALTAEPRPGQVVEQSAVLNKKSPWRLGDDAALAIYSEELGRLFLVEADGQPVVLDDRELAEARESRDLPT